MDAIKLLADTPLDRGTAQQWGADLDLGPLADALERQLGPALRGKAPVEPLRLGLYGGLGQGKSSVLRLFLETAAQPAAPKTLRGRIDAWRCRQRIAQFDVSHHKADDLEWRFLAAVLWRRVFWRLLLVAAPLAVIAAALMLYLFHDTVQQHWSLGGCVAEGWATCSRWAIAVGVSGLGLGTAFAVLPLVVPLLGWLVRAVNSARSMSPSKDINPAAADLLLHDLAWFTGAMPRLVIIDDLDRARVEQQRAFLRALLHYSRQMRFALLVAMDETSLLTQAGRDPEAPEELLRKVVTAELRLPPRHPGQLVQLLRALCAALAQANPGHPVLGEALHKPQWQADTARCLSLLAPAGSLSPRWVKHLLNDALLKAEQFGLLSATEPAELARDLGALLRLECLLSLVPALRQHPLATLHALESNHPAELERALSVCTPTPEPTLSQQALNLFNRSRAQQPQDHELWFTLLCGQPPESPPPGSATAHRTHWPPPALPGHGFVRVARHWRLALAHRARGLPMDLELTLKTSADGRWHLAGSVPGGGQWTVAADQIWGLGSGPPELTQLLAWLWPLCMLAWLQQEAPARNHLYDAVEYWLRPDSNDDDSARATLRGLLLRERLADSAAWALLGDARRFELLLAAQQQPTAGSLQLSTTPLPADLPQLLQQVLTAGGLNARQAAAWLGRVAEQMPVWPAAARPTESGEAHTFDDRIHQLWPLLPPQDNRPSAWQRALAAQGRRLVGSPRNDLPGSLALAWSGTGGDQLDLEQCLNVMAEGLPSDPAEWQAWHVAHLERWWCVAGPAHRPRALQALVLPGQAPVTWDTQTLEIWSLQAWLPRHPARALAVLALALMQTGHLAPSLAYGLKGLPPRTRLTLCAALVAHRYPGSAILSPSAQAFGPMDDNMLTALLAGCPEEHILAWLPPGGLDRLKEAVRAHCSQDAGRITPVFQRLQWIPI